MLVTIFWDEKDVILVDLMECGSTITADVYCEMLTKLRRAIQNQCCGKLLSGIILFHDDAHPHIAVITKKIQDFCWELFDHPPYSSSGFAPSPYFLFLHLKKWLGRQFENYEELKTAVNQFNSQR
ncbi:histone-lysine N-methyltransferase SETMAR-like [Lycorma delicatula]|uniref:histone-lysine N-methyltransferase SETMAR-like n=1 Tax=Lycorma delicatula TaxID=130591 RepID=UPI003F50D6EF